MQTFSYSQSSQMASLQQSTNRKSGNRVKVLYPNSTNLCFIFNIKISHFKIYCSFKYIIHLFPLSVDFQGFSWQWGQGIWLIMNTYLNLCPALLLWSPHHYKIYCETVDNSCTSSSIHQLWFITWIQGYTPGAYNRCNKWYKKWIRKWSPTQS